MRCKHRYGFSPFGLRLRKRSSLQACGYSCRRSSGCAFSSWSSAISTTSRCFPPLPCFWAAQVDNEWKSQEGWWPFESVDLLFNKRVYDLFFQKPVWCCVFHCWCVWNFLTLLPFESQIVVFERLSNKTARRPLLSTRFACITSTSSCTSSCLRCRAFGFSRGRCTTRPINRRAFGTKTTFTWPPSPITSKEAFGFYLFLRPAQIVPTLNMLRQTTLIDGTMQENTFQIEQRGQSITLALEAFFWDYRAARNAAMAAGAPIPNAPIDMPGLRDLMAGVSLLFCQTSILRSDAASSSSCRSPSGGSAWSSRTSRSTSPGSWSSKQFFFDSMK